MKRKLCVIALAVIAGLLVLAAAALYFLPISFRVQWPEMPEALPGDMLLSKEQVHEDREQMIAYVEAVHPFFVDGSDPKEYQEARTQYRAATAHAMTVDALMEATAKYLTVLGDGHTHLRWQTGDVLDVSVAYRTGKIYYADDGGMTDKWITAVDDVPVAQIFCTMDSLFPAENEMAVAVNYDRYFSSANLLRIAGVDVGKARLTISLSDGSMVECSWLASEPVENVQPETNHWYMDGDVFVVRFVSCTDDEQLKGIARELKRAVDAGCTKVIIDARGNGGGDSTACDRLLRAMGMKAPRYGMLVRFSEEVQEQRGYMRVSGTSLMRPSMSARRNERVKLVVLCDRFTYSSATMLCAYVRDGKLGILIGEASSNMPNCYGDITFVTLKNSQLIASVSHKRFLRPSGETAERTIAPDIGTTSAEAYQTALRFLNGEYLPQ